MTGSPATPATPEIPYVPVRTPIRLGQFLKLASLADSGAEGADLIAAGDVTVDDVAEQRRGRQLRGGEVVVVDAPGGRVAARVVAEH